MKILMVLPLVLLSACTCISYDTPNISASYCSTKDVRGLELEVDGIVVRLEGADNQASEFVGTIAKGVVEGIKGPAPVTNITKHAAPTLKDKIQDKIIERLIK